MNRHGPLSPRDFKYPDHCGHMQRFAMKMRIFPRLTRLKIADHRKSLHEKWGNNGEEVTGKWTGLNHHGASPGDLTPVEFLQQAHGSSL